MIKGVNRNIIEIKDPDSIYFEKAVLYVRPNVTFFPEAVRKSEAEKFLGRILQGQKVSAKRRFGKWAALIFPALLILAALLLLR